MRHFIRSRNWPLITIATAIGALLAVSAVQLAVCLAGNWSIG